MGMAVEVENADVVLAEFQKNKRETVRIRRTQYRGVELIDVRGWYQEGEELKPGKGLSIRVEQLPELRRALSQAEKALKAGKMSAMADKSDGGAE
jgi:hypothetical protein